MIGQIHQLAQGERKGVNGSAAFGAGQAQPFHALPRTLRIFALRRRSTGRWAVWKPCISR